MFVAKIINILNPYAVILSPEPRVSITTCPFKIISYGLLKVETIDNRATNGVRAPIKTGNRFIDLNE